MMRGDAGPTPPGRRVRRRAVRGGRQGRATRRAAAGCGGGVARTEGAAGAAERLNSSRAFFFLALRLARGGGLVGGPEIADKIWGMALN